MTWEQRYYPTGAPRALHIALAHCVARAKVDTPRMALLSKLFQQLSGPDQFRCRAELFECRAAQRGERLAEVAA